MLTIRPEQLAALDQAAFELFLRRLARFLGEEYPEHLAGADALPFVRETAAEGRRFGLETEEDLAMYAEAVLILGHGHEDEPILSDESLGTPSERIQYLWERLGNA